MINQSSAQKSMIFTKIGEFDLKILALLKNVDFEIRNK